MLQRCLFLPSLILTILFLLFPTFLLVVFPRDFLVNGIFGTEMAMLGLGDIVIPGVFIALLLRFDQTYVAFVFSVCVSFYRPFLYFFCPTPPL